MIWISDDIALDDDEIEESFVRASGPGGQNVNKVASAVQLRFDVRRSPNLRPDVAARLERIAGKRLTNDGILVIFAQRHRSQDRNRSEALERLVQLIQRATMVPKARRATRPTLASKKRRLAGKQIRSRVKSFRGPVGDDA